MDKRQTSKHLRAIIPAAVVSTVVVIGIIKADPGESYTTREQAVEAALHDVAQTTVDNRHDTEYSSVVYEQRNGGFSYTTPERQSDGHGDVGQTLYDVSIRGGNTTDVVHSHDDPGTYRPGFSTQDRITANTTRVDHHVVEPGLSENDPFLVHTRDFETMNESRIRVARVDDLVDTKDVCGATTDPSGDNCPTTTP